MNENLLRDLHDTQMEGLTAVKKQIDELAMKPTASPEDIAKLHSAISNIKIPEHDDTQLKEYFKELLTKSIAFSLSQFTEINKTIKNDNNNLINTNNSITKQLSELIEIQNSPKKPTLIIHRLDFSSWRVLISIISLIVICFGLCIYSYNQNIENSRLSANDLKYRYLKMKGEAAPSQILDLENIFELNRDNTKINEILKTVEVYETAVKERTIIDEQIRLKLQESEKLNSKAQELKTK